ncbi:hypothetical protein [Microbispora triticiradicis]|uniref:Uncharacterized protein n=2 Tax=Microbispora TaxID=2005 RepID=A0ABY3LUF3_9ACTN|nr:MULTISPECIES: hypothetical protein [Microbispora]TLP59525.1 hypothetical protein FED44_14535 [Microbispora fusca]TYB54291.1 hypothetical protein FXF59_22955 [Microbispora tritici]
MTGDRRVRGIGIAILAVGTSMLVACSAQPAVDLHSANAASGASRQTETRGSVDVSVLRVGFADFYAEKSPEALARKRPIVAAGIVDGWQQGPILESYPNGPLDYRIVLRVKITEPLKGVQGRKSIANNIVYIELDQGAVMRDDNLAPKDWKPIHPVSDFERAIPTGTPVLVFPRERPPHEEKVQNLGDALPANAELMTVHPQGLLFEDPALMKRRDEDISALVGAFEDIRQGGEAWGEAKSMRDMMDRLKRNGISGG